MAIVDTLNKNYQVTIYEREETSRRVTAWLADSPPTPSAGGGGYQIVNLPMRSSVTVWQGRTGLLLMDMAIFLWDEQPSPPSYSTRGLGHQGLGVSLYAEPISAMAAVRQLLRMWRPADDTEAPPVIRTSAKADVVPFVTTPWVLNDFQWGQVIGDEKGNRVLQGITLQLMEYRADEELKIDRLRTPKTNKRTRVYVVKQGDSLTAIAARYHLRNGWRQLANAQSPVINDPRNIRVGQKLIIPAA